MKTAKAIKASLRRHEAQLSKLKPASRAYTDLLNKIKSERQALDTAIERERRAK